MNNQNSQSNQKNCSSNSNDGFFSTFLDRFEKLWEDFDNDFDEMDKRLKEKRKLNGKATNHEIDL